ncbi:hypothetical protein OSB04_014197 [Centaurea solstitialis]|uniref:Uncharacterized protein n=1 Tax=Centaurea solstitialis TaxID=347529 RepID=A0AA38TEZ5_9ASTR|nr:hypothetical protein OSB04_014197 [Centaurea solstitialis]
MASCSSSSSSISLMASQTLILQNPTFLHPLHRPSFLPISIHKSTFSTSSISKPLRFSSTKNPKKPLILASISPSSSPAVSPIPPAEIPPLTGATRTATTLLAIAVAASKLLANKITKFAVNSNLSAAAGPLFFATMSGGGRPGRLHTPLTVVAAGMAKWLDIYSGVLLVRVLLSWFPNIPWDRQPLSAIRDLCDPVGIAFWDYDQQQDDIVGDQSEKGLQVSVYGFHGLFIWSQYSSNFARFPYIHISISRIM